MWTTDGYHPELGNWLFSNASNGCIPTKLHIKASHTIHELKKILSPALKYPEKIFLRGGAELGLTASLPEPFVLDNNTAEQFSSSAEKLRIDEYCAQLVFSDWISSAINLHAKIRSLNVSLRPLKKLM